jgi:hypothetical protein
MRDIISLLAQEVLGERKTGPVPGDLRRGAGRRTARKPATGDGRDATPADWCQTPPGEASLSWLAGGLGVSRGRRRGR